MRDEARRRTSRAVAGDDVDDAGREDLGAGLAEAQSAESDVCSRRLEHHRVAGHERRAAIFDAANISGWLNGMIRPTTP